MNTYKKYDGKRSSNRLELANDLGAGYANGQGSTDVREEIGFGNGYADGAGDGEGRGDGHGDGAGYGDAFITRCPGSGAGGGFGDGDGRG